VLYNNVKERLLKENEISEVSPVPFKRLVIVIQQIVLRSYHWKLFLDNRKVAVLQYPPYSPAHTPMTYYYSSKLKFTSNGWHFKSIMENEDAVYKENKKHYKRGLPRKDNSLMKCANWCSLGILKLPYPVQSEVNLFLCNCVREVKQRIFLMSPVMAASSLLHILVTLRLVSISLHLFE